MLLSDLWRDRNFLNLWLSQTISLIGSQISFLALPLTAVVLPDATPLQMGLLTAAKFLPPLARAHPPKRAGCYLGLMGERTARPTFGYAKNLVGEPIFGSGPVYLKTSAINL